MFCMIPFIPETTNIIEKKREKLTVSDKLEVYGKKCHMWHVFKILIHHMKLFGLKIGSICRTVIVWHSEVWWEGAAEENYPGMVNSPNTQLFALNFIHLEMPIAAANE